jgi:hypothetical protein
MVCEESRWISASVTTPHWLQVTLPGTFQIGSANVITGAWGVGVSNFKLQYWSGSAWTDIPGATVTGNTNSQRQIVFSSPVTTGKVRFYSEQGGSIAVKDPHPVRADAENHRQQPEQLQPAALPGL